MAIFEKLLALTAVAAAVVAASAMTPLPTVAVTVAPEYNAKSTTSLTQTLKTATPKPIPTHTAIVNGTSLHRPSPPVIDSQEFYYCGLTASGTCTVGLELSYDQVIMDVFIWDSKCKSAASCTIYLSCYLPCCLSCCLSFCTFCCLSCCSACYLSWPGHG